MKISETKGKSDGRLTESQKRSGSPLLPLRHLLSCFGRPTSEPGSHGESGSLLAGAVQAGGGAAASTAGAGRHPGRRRPCRNPVAHSALPHGPTRTAADSPQKHSAH